MRRRALRQLGATLAACVLAAACEGPTQPSRSNPPPPVIDPRPVLDSLAGSYTVTVNLSEQCAEIPLAVRQRRYQASLETTPYRYLTIRIVGGGFSDPIGIGDLQGELDGRVTLSWNDFDLGGCYDVYSEPLSDGSVLTVCGRGLGVQSGSTISGTLTGSAWIDENGKRRAVCSTTHQFTFTRATQSVISR